MCHVQIGRRHRVYGLITIVRSPLILPSIQDAVTCILYGHSLIVPVQAIASDLLYTIIKINVLFCQDIVSTSVDLLAMVKTLEVSLLRHLHAPF